MKKVKSPTGCVHGVAAGNEKDGWVTSCNHRDYFRWDGYDHHWPLTEDKITCKRCLAIMAAASHTFTIEIMYQWPASKVCVGCKHARKVYDHEHDEGLVLCDKKCKFNDGYQCPEREQSES